MNVKFAFGISLTNPRTSEQLPVKTVLGSAWNRVANILDAFQPMFPST
jgi:hypothetical protein